MFSICLRESTWTFQTYPQAYKNCCGTTDWIDWSHAMCLGPSWMYLVAVLLWCCCVVLLCSVFEFLKSSLLQRRSPRSEGGMLCTCCFRSTFRKVCFVQTHTCFCSYRSYNFLSFLIFSYMCWYVLIFSHLFLHFLSTCSFRFNILSYLFYVLPIFLIAQAPPHHPTLPSPPSPLTSLHKILR